LLSDGSFTTEYESSQNNILNSVAKELTHFGHMYSTKRHWQT